MLSFRLLGQVELSISGQPLSQFRTQKELALLIFLAQTGQTHQREFIAELLWDSRSTQQSLSNLRTLLTRLRKQVGDTLLITRKSLALAPESQQQIDSVNLLQSLANIGQVDTAEKATALQKALATYQGHFLVDFYLPKTPPFNEWVRATREYIRREVILAYDKLGQYVLSANDGENGMAVAQAWLKVDALNYSAHTLLIRLLIKAGSVPEAVAHYDMYVDLLRSELNIAPPPPLTALINSVKPQPAIRTQQAPRTGHNLPTVHDQFFGRRAVQQEIHARLDQPWCRLVTLVGPGGIGKTRLATTVARSRLSQYPDGVVLIELAEIDPSDNDLAEAIVVEIATVLNLRLSGSAKPIDQLISHLQHKQMLLVLDNFEHLLAGVQTVLDITQQCESVQLIVTSREVLQLKAEWTIALTGLNYPISDTDETQSAAVALFAARRAQQQWQPLAAEEVKAIRAICRLVEGLPLAIELAAALTHRLTCRAVADRLRDGFGALATDLRDVPLRQRNLAMVFEMSWQTLTPVLKAFLAWLSVFRGGFTETAANQIAAASSQQLTALIDKSLLSFDAKSGRYTLHATIREYAAKKRDPVDQTVRKHAHYYLTLLANHTEPLQKDAPQKSIEQFNPEIDNVRRAWQTGLDEQMRTLLYDALTSLSIFYQLRGLSREGELVMQTTLRKVTTWGGDGRALATRVGLEQARFQNRLGQYRTAIQTIITALKLAEKGGDRWAEGMGYVWWGESLWRLGQFKTAEKKLNHALNIAQNIDSTFIHGWCHHHLGIINDIQSRYDVALDHLEKACTAWRALNDTNKLSVSLNSIGLVYRNQGEMSAAKQTMAHALGICIEQDNRYLQAMLLNNLSSIHIMENDYFGAQYYLQLGLELACASGSLHSQSDIYINLGENYRFQGENELAVQNLERGLKIAKEIGIRPSMAEALCRLADVKRIQGDESSAERLYNQALKITRQDHLKSIECEVLIGLTELYNDINSVKAKQYCLEVNSLAKSINHPELLKRVEAVNHYLSLK